MITLTGEHKITATPAKLNGVFQIQRYPTKDFRGLNDDIYNTRDYSAIGINLKFISQNFSHSKKNVLRGLHGDSKTWKLISCLHGEIYVVVLNYDEQSEEFGRWESFVLSPSNGLQILVPPKFANGHVVLSPEAVFHYTQTELYAGAENQFSVCWNDPRFNIVWPIDGELLLSGRDRGTKS